MVLILGGLVAGKREFARLLGYEDSEMSGDPFDAAPVAVRPEEMLRRRLEEVSDPSAPSADLNALFAALSAKEAVISCEVGSGVVPLSAAERTFREETGRLQVRLAKEEDCVVRVIAGIPAVIKGEMPCTHS